MRDALKAALSLPEMASLPTVFRAFSLASSGSGEANERAAWESIERRRRDLLERSEVIEMIDYGVGDRNDVRTEQQQRSGVVLNIPISKLVRSSSDPVWCQVLFHLAHVCRPTTVLELGTCVGISGSYIAAALRMNGAGHLWTFEGSPTSAALAKETFGSLNLGDFVSISVGPFRKTLETCLQSVDAFDLAFIDGHHDGNATIDYFDQCKTKFLPGSIIVFDDVDFSESMERAWRHVTKDSGVFGSIRVDGGSSRAGRGIVAFGNKA